VIPLTVVAKLSSPIAAYPGPLLLDGILCSGYGGKLGSRRADKWEDPAVVCKNVQDGALPLERVTVGNYWWYAASQALPQGKEILRHLHKRIPQMLLEGYTTAKSVDIATGPDKSLRIPQYLRPGWLTIHWSCVGDPDEIADLLWRVPSLGRQSTHGNGWVRQWRLSSGHVIDPLMWKGKEDGWTPDASTTISYTNDLSLRHIPVELLTTLPKGQIRRHRIPLLPPYHTGYDPDSTRATQCWQMIGDAP